MTQVVTDRHKHEVFVNAPLQLVAMEVTHPVTDRGFDSALFAAIEEVLGGQTQSILGGQLRLSGPPAADGTATGESMLFRMTNQGRTVSVSAWPTSLIVECSEYGRYEDFRELVRGVVEAYAQYMVPTAVSRFGMRYIDEMHVAPSISSVVGWKPYVNPLLLGPATLVGERASNLAIGFTLDLGEHRSINVRCATTPSRALSSEGHLRLRERPNTPAFVLDIDAVFQPPEPRVTAVTGDVVVGLADDLRPGVRSVFDAVFTAAALDTFRGPGATS